MDAQELMQLIKEPEMLDQSTISGLKEMIDTYPFSPIFRILYLRNLKNTDSYLFEQELSKHAIFIPDRVSLYKMLNLHSKPRHEIELLPYDEIVLKEILDQTPVVENETKSDEFDFTVTDVFRLIEEKTDSLMKPQPEEPDLIDRFIHGEPVAVSAPEPIAESGKKLSEQSNLIGEELITETLAKVYLKQGLYDEALQSYQKLILKFPEKNSYFAGQIEKINKIISKR